MADERPDWARRMAAGRTAPGSSQEEASRPGALAEAGGCPKETTKNMDRIPKEQPDDLFVTAAENGRAGWVYAIRSRDTGLIKLGMSRDPKRRLRDLSTASSSELELLWSHGGGLSLEAFLHRYFTARHVRGEWFDFTDVDAVALLNHAVAMFVGGEE